MLGHPKARIAFPIWARGSQRVAQQAPTLKPGPQLAGCPIQHAFSDANLSTNQFTCTAERLWCCCAPIPNHGQQQAAPGAAPDASAGRTQLRTNTVASFQADGYARKTSSALPCPTRHQAVPSAAVATTTPAAHPHPAPHLSSSTALPKWAQRHPQYSQQAPAGTTDSSTATAGVHALRERRVRQCCSGHVPHAAQLPATTPSSHSALPFQT